MARNETVLSEKAQNVAARSAQFWLTQSDEVTGGGAQRHGTTRGGAQRDDAARGGAKRDGGARGGAQRAA